MNDEQQTKPGIRTTEFWLALLVILGGAVATVYPTNNAAQVAGLVAGALAAAGYGVSRALVKRGPAVGAEVNMVGGSLRLDKEQPKTDEKQT